MRPGDTDLRAVMKPWGEKRCLFRILECAVSLFSGSDFDDVLHVVDKDLAVTDMAGVQNLLAVSTTRRTGSLHTTMDT